VRSAEGKRPQQRGVDEAEDSARRPDAEREDEDRERGEARRLRDEPMTLEDLSVKYDISRERVRQIEVRAFEKLQEKMKQALAHKRAETLDAT